MPPRAEAPQPSIVIPAATLNGKANLQVLVRDLGRMPYDEALALQRECVQEVIAGREAARGAAQMHLLLVEHDPPVITISRRRSARQHLIASEAQLKAAGVEVAETDRGGDITYHGPGQLVVYPILDLNAMGLRLHSYMRLLEQIVIDVLAQFAIQGERDPGATGVWVGTPFAMHCEWGPIRPAPVGDAGLGSANSCAALPAARLSKICAMGVRITRWVSMHGLALNVTTNLDHFNLIVPCGLAGRSVTSLQRELGIAAPSMDTVKAVMVQRFHAAVRHSNQEQRGVE